MLVPTANEFASVWSVDIAAQMVISADEWATKNRDHYARLVDIPSLRDCDLEGQQCLAEVFLTAAP